MVDIHAEALVAPPVIIDPGEGYSAADRIFQGIPGIERTASGRLWATWYGGGEGEGPDNYVVLVTSDDDGHTWSDELLVVNPPGAVRAFDEVVWTDPLGRLWLFWSQSHNKYDGRAGVWAIRNDTPDDEPRAWSSPRRIADGVMMNKPIVLSTGEWMFVPTVWDYDTMPPGQQRGPGAKFIAQCDVLVSEDQGETFTLRGGADAHDPAQQGHEHMVVERADGSIWMLMRMKYGLAGTVSTDRGCTWPLAQPLDIDGPGSRFFIRRLESERLLLVNHHDWRSRENEPGYHGRNNLAAFLSEDDGATWSDPLMIDERFGVTYPDGTQSDDGRIHVIYDYGRKKRGEILMATFREEDILAGRIVSPDARLRVVVSRMG